ncbi:MAG: hypothetical protein FWF54_02845 [Candidatus Azobacteroides sp.]|nr:hypothetical protein [Candidatus Azobacteroides sp.]
MSPKSRFSADNGKSGEKQDFSSDGRQAVKQFIEANYRPERNIDEKEFKSSMQLEYELREMTDASVSTITSVMNELGFQVRYLEGKPYWVVYQSVF